MKDVIREQGISQDTFYRWRWKYGGFEVNEAKRLRELEDENRRLKRWVADLTLDNRALKDVVSRKNGEAAGQESGGSPRPAGPRPERTPRLSAGWDRTLEPSLRAAPGPDDEALRQQLVELAGRWRRSGYRGLHRVLRRQGTRVNLKRVYRVVREAGLQVRRRQRKRLKRAPRGPMPRPERPNEVWAMDFVHDGLVEGRRIRALTILDLCTREAPWIEVATSIPGDRVVRVLERLAEVHGLPKRIISDNGSEFRSLALATWAEKRGVELDFIAPASPCRTPSSRASTGRSGTSA